MPSTNELRCALAVGTSLMLWFGGRHLPRLAEGSKFQFIINHSAMASELAMSALTFWQPSLRHPFVRSWETGPGFLADAPRPLELARCMRKGRQGHKNHM